MDEAGAVIRRKRVASSPAGVREAIGDLQEPMKAVLEASYCWGPMYDWLAEFAEDVVLAHPAKVRAIADARIKTDTIDSRMLAHLLRADLIPEAYAPTKETRATKRACCSTYSSGNHVFHGGLTKQGNKWLRWGFIEAVAPAIRVSPFLRRYYDRIKARCGAHDARVCTARKLAELVWTVWMQQRCYVHR